MPRRSRPSAGRSSPSTPTSPSPNRSPPSSGSESAGSTATASKTSSSSCTTPVPPPTVASSGAGATRPSLPTPPASGATATPTCSDGSKRPFGGRSPNSSDVKLERGWGGPVCGTVDTIATVRWLKGQRIAYALGYSGHGVAPSRLAAKISRDLLLGRKTDLLSLPFHTHRPIPLPQGGPLRSLALERAHRELMDLDDHPERASSLRGRAVYALMRESVRT